MNNNEATAARIDAAIASAVTMDDNYRFGGGVPADARYRAIFSGFWGEAYGYGPTREDALMDLRRVLAFNLEHNGVLI